MKKQYLIPATQEQSVIAMQVFMVSPEGKNKGKTIGGGSSEEEIHIS